MNSQITVMGSIEHYVRWIPPPAGRSDTGVKITYYTGIAYCLKALALNWTGRPSNVGRTYSNTGLSLAGSNSRKGKAAALLISLSARTVWSRVYSRQLIWSFEHT